MPSLNEQIYSTPSAKRALNLYNKRLGLIESVRAKAGKPKMTYEQRLATATALANTQRQIRALESLNYGGATQPSSIGQYKRFALDMVGTVTSSLIAPEVVSMQTIENKVGMVNILEYQYGSDKGSARAGQTFASPLGYQGMNPYYTTSSVDGEIVEDVAEGGNTYRLKYTPVKPGSIKVVDKDGNIKEGVTLVDAFTGEISGVANEDRVYYLYDNETAPVTTPQIKIDIKSIPIEAKSRKLSAIWSFDAQYELAKEYGQDIHTLLATQATSEITQEIDNEITLDLYRIANAGPEVAWSRVQPVGVNLVDHYDSFWNKLIEGSNQIFSATRRARANFMIGGLGVDSVVRSMRNFVPSEDLSAVGPHFIGTLGGQIKVYTNPNYEANTFVLGYKGDTLMDSGYIYAPYLPIVTTGMVTLADDMGSREGWATSYGKKAINPRLYVKGRIDG